ncbi:hypothetical protein [Deinococcus budaensis]|uniref:Uncharacterized protein n=1 Tax=Deinococcus budaensis TaxID=1665626 RepID=A0A7W8GHV2_9DEIO|nr:hypothetical protein [Deinococcus budaensis]MBB5235922.1 hypothetical protein [Deinococcus budaensis]
MPGVQASSAGRLKTARIHTDPRVHPASGAGQARGEESARSLGLRGGQALPQGLPPG